MIKMPERKKTPRRLRRFQRAEYTPKQIEHREEPEKQDRKVLGFGKLYEEFQERKTSKTPGKNIEEGRPKDLSDKLFEQMHEKEIRQRARNLTQERMKEFKETHQRMPNEEEVEVIAEGIFEQAKDEFLKAREVEKEEKKLARAAKRLIREEKTAVGEEKLKESELAPDIKEESEERHSRRHRGRRRGREKKPEQEKEKKEIVPVRKEPKELKSAMDDIKGLSVEGLFDKDEVSADKPAKPSGGDKMEEELKLIGLDEEPAAEKEEEKSLFCPECGNEFSDSTAAGKEVQEDGIKYTCPSCKKTVKVSK